MVLSSQLPTAARRSDCFYREPAGPTLWRSLSIFKTLCELNRVWLWAVGAEESRKPRLPGIPMLGVGGDGGGQCWG